MSVRKPVRLKIRNVDSLMLYPFCYNMLKGTPIHKTESDDEDICLWISKRS